MLEGETLQKQNLWFKCQLYIYSQSIFSFKQWPDAWCPRWSICDSIAVIARLCLVAACTGAHSTAQYRAQYTWLSCDPQLLGDSPTHQSRSRGSEIMTPQWGNTQGNKILDQILIHRYVSRNLWLLIVSERLMCDVQCWVKLSYVLQVGWYCWSSSQTRHFPFIPPAPAGVWHHQHFIDFLYHRLLGRSSSPGPFPSWAQT